MRMENIINGVFPKLMLYNLLTPFKDLYSIFNLFEYITFRAGASAILALLISFFGGLQ